MFCLGHCWIAAPTTLLMASLLETHGLAIWLGGILEHSVYVILLPMQLWRCHQPIYGQSNDLTQFQEYPPRLFRSDELCIRQPQGSTSATIPPTAATWLELFNLFWRHVECRRRIGRDSSTQVSTFGLHNWSPTGCPTSVTALANRDRCLPCRRKSIE